MYLTPFVERWTVLLGRIGALLALPLVAAMMYEIISRQFFDAPTFWAFELAYMMMGTIFMFGIAYALKTKSHVNVDLVYHVLSPRWQGMVMLVGCIFLIPCVAWVTYALFWYFVGAYEGAERSGMSAWNPVIWPFRLVYVIGFATFLLQLVAEVEKALFAIVTNTRPEEA